MVPGAAALMVPVEKPAVSCVASAESMVPALQTAPVVRAALISTTSVVSISAKETVPLAVRS